MSPTWETHSTDTAEESPCLNEFEEENTGKERVKDNSNIFTWFIHNLGMEEVSITTQICIQFSEI